MCHRSDGDATHRGVGDAVADDLVDGGAAGLGEAAVVERGRVRPALHRLLVHDRVDIVRRHAHAQGARHRVQHLPRDPPRRAHRWC